VRKAAELALQRAHDELELRVRERTAELEQKNLQLQQEIHERKLAELRLAKQAQELARSNADLEQFASVASHDLQEPLRMVASYTQLLVKRYRGRIDSDADEFMTFIVDGALRMQRLINDLLTFSRLGTRGKEFKSTSLQAVMQRVMVNLQPMIQESGAEVRMASLPAVTSDETQLEMLLQNLVSNAIKFHGRERPSVAIDATRQDGEWVISVSDQGIGIDPKYADRIFVIFQRLHTSAEYPGTGIGLAICKKIVERHGGRIWVTSEPGHGATFSFTLPHREEGSHEPAATAH
jgi:light-regulated signal transduction histidine kinase (bacteriophytochrome)